MSQPVPNYRCSPCLLGSNHCCPKACLVPAEQLSRKSHQKRQEEEPHPSEPVHLTGILVGTHEIHSNRVYADQNDHRGSAKIVDPPHDASERSAAYEKQAVVCLS